MATVDPFPSFPKTRAPLPPDYAAIYLKHYRNSREGNSQILGLAQRMERWMHGKVARDAMQTPKATLELGAGNLNQLPYEPRSAPYDIVEPFRELFESSPHLERVRNVYHDILKVPENARYQRITSVAVLEHVENLPELVARSALLLDESGSFRAGIPSEGTILWRLGWQLTTALDFRARYGLNYKVLMQYEHVNTAAEIEEVLRYFFDVTQCRVFGLMRSLSFYQFFSCSQPRLDRCLEYVKPNSAAGRRHQSDL